MTRLSQDAVRVPLLCVRITNEERTLLKQLAGDLPLSTYVRNRLFFDQNDEVGREMRLSARTRQKLLSKLLMLFQ